MLRYRIWVAVFFFLFGLTLAATSYATPGARHIVQGNNTNIYKAPSNNAPIVMQLNQGDRVIEWQRQGSWVKISQMGVFGSEGWVESSRIALEPPIKKPIEIELNSDNQFMLEAKVNGKTIRFVVDTGANITTLSLRDAKKVGFRKSSLKFNRISITAGGEIRVAAVKLEKIVIGKLTVRDLYVHVNKVPMPISLLGMNFLRRLESYEVRDDKLVMRY